MAAKTKTAEIKRSARNKKYYANLYARNKPESIAYLRHHINKGDLIKVIKDHFPAFTIQDLTLPKERKTNIILPNTSAKKKKKK